MLIKNLFNDLICLLFPNLCAACGKPLVKYETMLCLGCLAGLPRTHFQHQPDNMVAQMFWGRVQVVHAGAYVYFQKGGHVQQLLHKLKYKSQQYIGVELGKLMAIEIADSLFRDIDIIVPVPLHKSRLQKRGYNQSECIARGLGERMHLPVATGVLVRVVANPTQTRKHRYERWMNVEGIFFLKHPATLARKHVLLVDDVVTTGATLEACAVELLKAAGCRVSILTVAVA